MSPRTSGPTGMPSIWETKFTILERASDVPFAFSNALRRKTASSCQGERPPNGGLGKSMPSGKVGTPRRERSWLRNVTKGV